MFPADFFGFSRHSCDFNQNKKLFADVSNIPVNSFDNLGRFYA